jgi:virulence-associated protein VagC
VRLPKQFRLSSAVVFIHREGARLVLEPPAHQLDANGWPKGFWANLATVGDDFELGDRGRRQDWTKRAPRARR